MVSDTEHDIDTATRRADLIHLVQRGDLEPSTAEAKAAQAGCGPLESTPPPGQFDPMRLDVWTLPMTIAWIAWRTTDAVREWWDSYREQCLHWVGHSEDDERAWYSLEAPPPATVATLQLCELSWCADENEGAPGKSIDQAKAELWTLLHRGVIEATGVDCASNERVTIAPAEWPDLKVTDVRGRDVLQVISDFPFGRRYGHVHFDAQQIRQLWLPRLALEGVVPTLRPPEGKGHMPLSCAAMWIATQGGTADFSRTREVWQDALDRLLDEIVAEDVEAIGMHDGVMEPIDANVFSSCRVSYPFDDWHDDVIFGDDLVLVCCPYLDDDHWYAGFDDSLRNCHGARWTRISVGQMDIGRIWSFRRDAASYRTAKPGRPSSQALVIAEYKQQRERGEMGKSQRTDAKKLASWLRKTHPEAPSANFRAIEKMIRELRKAEVTSERGAKQ